MRKNLTQSYHDTCDRTRLPNFQEKRPIHSKTPSLEGTTKPVAPPSLTRDTGKTAHMLTNSSEP